jgi:hypothetical protein
MTAGRPLKYATPAQLQEAVDAYFDSEDGKLPTITGLALHLGFADRSSLIDYAERDEFFHTIKTAKLRVEAFIERRLYEANATGCIFNLKNNFGWEDRTKSEQMGEGGGPLKATAEVRWTIVDPTDSGAA